VTCRLNARFSSIFDLAALIAAIVLFSHKHLLDPFWTSFVYLSLDADKFSKDPILDFAYRVEMDEIRILDWTVLNSLSDVFSLPGLFLIVKYWTWSSSHYSSRRDRDRSERCLDNSRRDPDNARWSRIRSSALFSISRSFVSVLEYSDIAASRHMFGADLDDHDHVLQNMQ
jgi:hypothetical protein